MLNSNLEAIPRQISAKLLACAVAAAQNDPKSQQLEILALEVIGPALGRKETSIISSTVGVQSILNVSTYRFKPNKIDSLIHLVI